MNYIYTKNPKDPLINLDNIDFILIDEDNDIIFQCGDISKYWVCKNIEEAADMKQRIANHVKAANLSDQIKFE